MKLSLCGLGLVLGTRHLTPGSSCWFSGSAPIQASRNQAGIFVGLTSLPFPARIPAWSILEAER